MITAKDLEHIYTVLQGGDNFTVEQVAKITGLSEEAVAFARQKLIKKQLDIIVANDITATDSGFDVDTNRVTIIDREGTVDSLPLLTKGEVADRILDRVVGLLAKMGKR